MEIENQEECSCNGTGWIETTEEQERIVSIFDEKTGKHVLKKEIMKIPVVIPCPYCNKTSEHLKFQLNIPSKYQSSTLENFETLDDPVLTRVKLRCKEYIEHYPRLRDQSGLIFMGPPGVGKTHLAVSVLKKIAIKYNLRAKFYDFREILSLMRRKYQEQGYWSDENIFYEFNKYDLLVIDEFGSEQMTNWVREVYHRLIIPRYNENLATIFTTNYCDNEYPAVKQKSLKGSLALKDAQETLEERIGIRLRSKLKEMCQDIRLIVPDFREQIVRKSANTALKRSKLFQNIHRLADEFYLLEDRTQEGYYNDAYQYNHSVALQNPDATAIWIFGRRKGELASTVSLWKFIRIFELTSQLVEGKE